MINYLELFDLYILEYPLKPIYRLNLTNNIFSVMLDNVIYEPYPIVRSEITKNKFGKASVNVSMLYNEFFYFKMKEKLNYFIGINIFAYIKRLYPFEDGNFYMKKLLFSGFAKDIYLKDYNIVFSFVDIVTFFDKEIPYFRVSLNCQNNFGDKFCRLNPNDYYYQISFNTNSDIIFDRYIEININENTQYFKSKEEIPDLITPNPDKILLNILQNTKIEIVYTNNIIERIAKTLISNDKIILILNESINDNQEEKPEYIKIFFRCDKTLDCCKRLNNVNNFNGFPYFYYKNPVLSSV